MKLLLLFDTMVGSGNTGDEVIYRSFQQHFSPVSQEYFTLRFGTHLQNYSFLRYMRMSHKRGLVDSCDYKIIVGTGLLSSNLLRSRQQWPIDIRYIGMYKNSIMAGVGTIHNRKSVTAYSRFLYKRILSQEALHSARDEQSTDLLRDLGVRAINTGCPSIWSLTPEFCRSIPVDKASRVVFSLTDHRKNLNADQKMLDVLQRNYDELFLWCQCPTDEGYFNSLHCTKPVRLLYSLEAYEKLLESGDIDYVGTRLHGGIFALQHRVRSVILAVDHRARGFRDDFNLPVIERNDVDVLENLLHNQVRTEVKLKQANINQWLAQFEADT